MVLGSVFQGEKLCCTEESVTTRFCIICAELTVVIKSGKTWLGYLAGMMD